MNEPSKTFISIEMVTWLQSTQNVQPEQIITRPYSTIQKQAAEPRIQTSQMGIVWLFL
jgi:hypothetical protein